MSRHWMCVVALATCAGAAQAQYHEYLPEQGSMEVGLNGSFNFKPVDSVNLGARLGYFLGRSLQVGAEGAYTRIENGSSQRAWSLGAFGNWHFPGTSALLPYAGVFAGVTDSSGADASNALGLQGGAKYFLNRNVATFAELRWRTLDDSADQTGVFVGISVLLR